MRQGMIYNIQRMSVHDGPGLRTTVFLKGCPLRCLWCSNPESQETTPQLLFFANLCTGCGKCVDVCPNGASHLADGAVVRDAARCTHCGLCAQACPAGAREMSGRVMTVDEVMEVVLKDMLFYENSGGGVTFGGGEPTAGGQFLLDLMQASRDLGLHVAVDTCGFCAGERFDGVMALADLFLFDCKHVNPEAHRRLTGRDNAPILRNLRAALASGTEVRVRMPLVPGMNDDDANLAALAALLGEYDRNEVDVMPCHAFGRSKHAALGLPEPAMPQYAPEQLARILDRFAKHGLVPVMV